MASDISEVHAHGEGRFKFSYLDSDGKRVSRTGRSRRVLEGERLRLFDAAGTPASAPAPIGAVKGTAAWWRELAEGCAERAWDALQSGDSVAASLARKTAASVADLCRSGSIAQQVAELEIALEELVTYCESTLKQLGFKSTAYEEAAAGYTLLLKARALLAGEDPHAED